MGRSLAAGHVGLFDELDEAYERADARGLRRDRDGVCKQPHHPYATATLREGVLFREGALARKGTLARDRRRHPG